MKLAAKALIAAGVAAGLWSAATAVSGHRIEQALRAQAEQWRGGPDAMIRITDIQYDKQFRSATRTLKLELGCRREGQEPLQLTWQDRVEHGPFPGGMAFGPGRVHSQLVLSDEAQAGLKAAKRSDQPIELHTTLGWNGSTDTQFSVPALAYQQGDDAVELEGLRARLQVDREGNARYSGELPGYSVRDSRGIQMQLKSASFEGEGFGPQWWLTSGKGQGKLQTLNLMGPGSEGGSRTWLGLQDLQYTQDGRIADGLYSSEGQMSGRGEIAGVALEALKLRASFKRLRLDAYGELMTRLLQEGCATPADPKAHTASLEQALGKLLPANPEMSLDELSVTVKGQKASLQYRVGTQGIQAEELKAGFSPALLQKLVAQLALEVPLPLVQQVLEAQGKPMPPEALTAQVDAAVARGFLKRKDERLSLQVEFKNGAATLNGQPLPVPGLTPPPLPKSEAQ